MKTLSPRPAALFLLLSLAASFVSAGTLKQDVISNVVQIEIEGHLTGTGICFRHDGKLRILTAAHVADVLFSEKTEEFFNAEGKVEAIKTKKPRPAEVVWRDGSRARAVLFWMTKDWRKLELPDLAILELEASEKAVELYKRGLGAKLLEDDAWKLKKEERGLEEGEDVWFCGAGGGLPFSLEKTIVNYYDERFVRINGIGWYGHSGSGVFVKRGDTYYLTGIVSHFAMSPEDNPRSPINAEKGLFDFVKKAATVPKK